MLVAAGLWGGVATTPAAAADLGGNCCADLEERVAELEATTARKGNRRVSLTVSGQVNTAILAWDSGDDSDTYVVDNANSSTGFQFNGSASITPDLKAGFEIAISITAGARSHEVTQFDDDGGDDARSDSEIVMTRASWYLDHKRLGRLSLGRINTATAGISTVNLGGTGVVASANIGYWQRSFFVSVDGNATGITWAEALGGNTVNGSGLSRANAVSYTSPTFGGFSVSAAWGEDDLWDVALRYAGEHGGFRLAAAIGYADNAGGTGEASDLGFFGGPESDIEPNQWKGSASIMHLATGLYLTGAFVNQDNDVPGVPDTTLWYLQGGIAKNWTQLGKTVLYAEYARVDDPAGASGFAFDSEANMWGIGVVQHVDAAAMELYLAFRQYSAEAEIGYKDYEADDFNAVMSGARIRF